MEGCTSERKILCGESYMEVTLPRVYGSSSAFPEGYLSEMSGLFGLQAPLKLALLSRIWEMCRDSEDFSVKFGKVERMEFASWTKCQVQTVHNILGSLVNSGLVVRVSRGIYSVNRNLFPNAEELETEGLVLRICIDYRIIKRR